MSKPDDTTNEPEKVEPEVEETETEAASPRRGAHGRGDACRGARRRGEACRGGAEAAPALATKGTPEVKEAAKAGRQRATGTTVERPVVRAQARYVRTSARKARLVCDLLRGKDIHEARAILAYSQRSVARDWAKVLESAIANAEHNHELVGDDLRILTASADEGPTLKRFRPRAMGRATRIRKRTSHLTITLTPKE